MQLVDNWWHTRKYFQAVRYYLELHHGKQLPEAHEADLVLIVAAIRTARDPIPFVLLIDHVLRELWAALAKMTGSAGQSSPLLKILFNELTLFTYGTAVTAVVTRCDSTRNTVQFIKVRSSITDSCCVALPDQTLTFDQDEWYAKLRAWSARCANIDCNRALPDAKALSGPNMRALFSVGTREARIGNKGFRALISNNRNYGYPCLWSVIRCWL